LRFSKFFATSIINFFNCCRQFSSFESFSSNQSIWETRVLFSFAWLEGSVFFCHTEKKHFEDHLWRGPNLQYKTLILRLSETNPNSMSVRN
jgi:hypothetical protein